MNATPLLAYTRWHAIESLPRLLTPLGLFAFLGGISLWVARNSVGVEALQQPGQQQAAILMMYSNALSFSITLGAIALAAGFIALDRERQHFRFLFSHPVVPWQHYLQRYVVSLLLFSLVLMIIPLWFRATFLEVPVLAVGASALLYALLYGSLALLCGALVNKDGIAFIGVVLIGNSLQQSAPALPAWLQHLASALPPFRVADTVRADLLASRAVDTGDLFHVVAYSVALLAAALFIVRRAPLAR